MAENNEIPYKEWLQNRRTFANANAIRAQAFYDSDKNGMWTWLRDLFIETSRIYDSFDYIDNEIAKGNKKIMKMFRTMLGLDDSATIKDLEERAKILGALVEGIMDKAIQNAEKEQRIKDKVFKGS